MSHSGFLLVDKPKGWTSHDVVAKVRGLLKSKAVGHSGTLDPFATGLMVLLVGESTKLSDYLRSSEKSYRWQAQLGAATDTLDATGTVVSQASEGEMAVLVDDELVAKAESLQGVLKLPVPVYSAKKVDGKKLYELARAGQDIEAPLKDMEFFALKELLPEGDGVWSGLISCGSGAFIRSWAHEWGRVCEVGAHLTELRRTECCGYSLSDAVTLEHLAKLAEGHTKGAGLNFLVDKACWIPMRQAMPHWRSVVVAGRDLKLLRNGQISYDLERRLNPEQRRAQREGKAVQVKVLSDLQGEWLSLLEAPPGDRLRIRKNFITSSSSQ